MTREKAKERESLLLLRRHNKQNYPKLKTCSIVIPEDIIDILCQNQKRTDEQNLSVEAFREDAYNQLCKISKDILAKRQEKTRRTREERLENNPHYIKHFGVWIDQTLPSAKISKENYAHIDPVSTNYSYNVACYFIENGLTNHLVVDNEQKKVYLSEVTCLEHRERCLKNFDINMQHFSSINHSEFDERLLKFAKGRKFQQVFSLDESLCTSKPYDIDGVCGFIYIMVLDAYNQAYIGITKSSVKNRIRQHWNKTKPFDRLLFGNVNTSVLSIDSFGPLDTTRIFVKPYLYSLKTSLENYENICIRAFGKNYLLNRLR